MTLNKDNMCYFPLWNYKWLAFNKALGKICTFRMFINPQFYLFADMLQIEYK